MCIFSVAGSLAGRRANSPAGWLPPRPAHPFRKGLLPPARQLDTAPLFVPGPVSDVAWERTVNVLHAYHFSIEKENRLDGTLETVQVDDKGLADGRAAGADTVFE